MASGAAAQTVTLSSDRARAATGEVVAFTARVTNTGTAALSMVKLGVGLDAGLALARVDAEGTFDLAPGAAKDVLFTAVVDVSAHPGDAPAARVRLLSAAGTPLGPEASATIHIAGDDLFDDSAILGRVSCGRRPIFGARVHIDTGATARTDAGGAYHFTRIPPGLHLLKIEADSLPPGALPKGDPGHLVTLQAGIPRRVDFTTTCPDLREVGPDSIVRAPNPLRSARSSVAVTGDLSTLTAAVDGLPLSLSAVDVTLDGLLLPRATANLRPPDGTPVKFHPKVSWATGGRPRAWALRIVQVLPRTRPVRTLSAAGAPPATIAWDGLDDSGLPAPKNAVFEAQLRVAGDDRALAASPRLRFGITFGLNVPPLSTRVLRGAHRSTLDDLSKLAAALGPIDRVTIEVHDDGTGDPIEKLAATQKLAEVYRDRLAQEGVEPARVQARGRGNLAPLVAGPQTEADLRRNRRVIVRVARMPAHPGAPIPAAPAGRPEALVDGNPATLDRKLRFARTLPLPAGGEVLVDLLGVDGRQASRVVRTPPMKLGPDVELRPPPSTPINHELAGDVAAGTLAIDGAAVDTRILATDLRVRWASPLSRRIVVEPVLPAGVELAAWDVAFYPGDAVADTSPLDRLAGAGAPPPALTWQPPTGVQRVRFRLTVEARDGSRASSPAQLVDLALPVAAGQPGPFFSPAGDPTAELRRRLADFVARGGRPDERLRLEVAARLPAATNDAEARLVRATRAGRVRAVLETLGGPVARAEIVVVPTTDDVERLAAAAWRALAEQAPAVLVDGAARPLTRTAFRVTTSGVPAVVELRQPAGRRAAWVVGQPPPQPAPIPKVPDLRPPPVDDVRFSADEPGARELETALAPPRPQVDARAPVAGLRVELAQKLVLRSRQLWVPGRVPPGVEVRINQRPVVTRADGSFDELVELPPGSSTLVITAQDRAGNLASVRRPVEVEDGSFLLLLAEAFVSEDGLTGRLAAFGRLEFSGAKLFGEGEVTLHVDTAKRRELADFFVEEHDPTIDFGVLGDSAVETRQAAQGRDPFVLRARAGESHATFGSFATAIGAPGELFSYDRTLSGGDLDLRAGSHRLRAFAATGDERLLRAVDLFRATGGALYYLRHARLVAGGERVRVVVRDRDSGLVLADRPLARDTDYSVDDVRGRILLKEPLASTADSRAVLTSLSAALDMRGGHPVYLEVGYEYQPDAGAGRDVAGAEVRERIGGVLTVGGGIVDESQGYQLAGADAELRPAPRTALRVELARSRGEDAGHSLSMDGGLGFASVGAVGTGGELGWKAQLTSTLGDFATAKWAERTRLDLYAQELDDGFRSSGALLEQGRRKLGGTLNVGLARYGDASFRLDRDETDERSAQRSTLRWAKDGKRLGVAVEGVHQKIGESERLGAGARAALRVAPRVVLTAAQEVQGSVRGPDAILDDEAQTGLATTVGADVELAPRTFAGAGATLRWNGDTAAQVGLRTPVDERASMYLQQRLLSRGATASVIGAEERFPAGRTYGEYQIEQGVAGPKNRAVLGLGRQFAVAQGLRLAAGYEHQEIDVAAAHQKRDVVHGSVELLVPERLKASASIELRLDDADGEVTDDEGPVPGAPLVLPPGQRRQIVATAGADWKLTSDHTFLGRFRLGDTRDEDGDAEIARHLELTAGWAVRPLELDWLDLLVRYSYLADRRPDTVLSERAHVLAVAPIFTLPEGVSVGGKLAWKHTARDAAGADALLVAVRFGYNFAGRWEAAFEGRVLNLDRPGGTDSRAGALLEVAYDLARHARIAAGYDFSRFSGDELADLERDGHGFFVRVAGRY